MSRKHQTHLFICNLCNSSISVWFNAQPDVRGYEVLSGCRHYRKGDVIHIKIMPENLVSQSIPASYIEIEDKPSEHPDEMQ